MPVTERPILLTGATGFVGAHLARALTERGDDLRLTVRESSDTREIDDLDAEQVTCDVLDRRAVRRAMKGVDRVFHAAGDVSANAAGAVAPVTAPAAGPVESAGTAVVGAVEQADHAAAATLGALGR